MPQISNRAELGKPLSTTSNLLFGNLQHRVDENSWVPVHGFRRGRIKLLAGSPAPSRGGQSRPHCCRSMRSRFGVLPSARFRFQSLHSHQARTCCSSIFRMRCHMRTAKRRITATSAIFFFFGLFMGAGQNAYGYGPWQEFGIQPVLGTGGPFDLAVVQSSLKTFIGSPVMMARVNR